MAGHRRRVLVVEDDAATRAVLVDTLTGEGYEVRAGADGAAGIALLRSRRPEAVLLDVTMPELDATEFRPLQRDARAWRTCRSCCSARPAPTTSSGSPPTWARRRGSPSRSTWTSSWRTSPADGRPDVRALLRPLCWVLGHRWENTHTLAGPLLRCLRCGAVRAF